VNFPELDISILCSSQQLQEMHPDRIFQTQNDQRRANSCWMRKDCCQLKIWLIIENPNKLTPNVAHELGTRVYKITQSMKELFDIEEIMFIFGD
jgi:hypothetical protein